ncbi:hypothetical protein GCM10027031_03200 [Corynebacterium atrinae]
MLIHELLDAQVLLLNFSEKVAHILDDPVNGVPRAWVESLPVGRCFRDLGNQLDGVAAGEIGKLFGFAVGYAVVVPSNVPKGVQSTNLRKLPVLR